MDALTHAVEAYVSTMATPTTDAAAIKAIELISKYLREAVAHGEDVRTRDMMAHAEYLAGIAFNNASLGYVHSMAHQLGGLYDLPHGVCNAILLPYVEMYNKQVCPGTFCRYRKGNGREYRRTEPGRSCRQSHRRHQKACIRYWNSLRS